MLPGHQTFPAFILDMGWEDRFRGSDAAKAIFTRLRATSENT